VMEARSIGSSSWLITGTLGGGRPLGVGMLKVGISFAFIVRGTAYGSPHVHEAGE
jgi:hypothetical protein